MLKDSNWKCLGEKSSGVICMLRDKCARNKNLFGKDTKYIIADFNAANTECENFLEIGNEISVKNLKENNRKKKEIE